MKRPSLRSGPRKIKKQSLPRLPSSAHRYFVDTIQQPIVTVQEEVVYYRL